MIKNVLLLPIFSILLLTNCNANDDYIEPEEIIYRNFVLSYEGLKAYLFNTEEPQYVRVNLNEDVVRVVVSNSESGEYFDCHNEDLLDLYNSDQIINECERTFYFHPYKNNENFSFDIYVEFEDSSFVTHTIERSN